jgi:hypothetical protein
MSGKGFKSLPAKARSAIVLCAVAAMVVTTYLVITQQEWSIGRLALLLALGIATARKKVQIMGTSSVSLLTSIVLLAVMWDGPGAAVLVAICGVVTQTIQPGKKLVVYQAAFNAGMIALTAAASALSYQAIVGSPGFADELLGMLVASIAYFLGNSVFVAMIIGLSKSTSILRIWRDCFANTAPSFVIGGLISMVMLQLLAHPAVVLLLITMLYPVYYSSIRLATRTA